MSAPPTKKKIVQYGLSVVFSAPDPEVDIVFVHGLNGNPFNTWATPHSFWPQDLLPQALKEQRCRILTYGYDANVGVFTDGTSNDKIHNHAERLASHLVANRSLKKALERPIIFICHSLGGLLVKRCLIYCKDVHHAHTERLRSIYVSTYGILFLGTPHTGSDLAKWGTLLQHICSAVLPKEFFDTSPQLIEALKTNNETLQNINRLFLSIIGRYHVYFFYESKLMDLKGTRSLVVDEDSAAPCIDGVELMGIERDHISICKFEDENASGYNVAAEAVQRYADAAPRLVKQRWDEEKRIREFKRQGAVQALQDHNVYQMTGLDALSRQQEARPSQLQPFPLGTYAPESHAWPNPFSPGQEEEDYEVNEVDDPIIADAQPLLITPLGFRPNSIFYGFETELEQLELKLHNRQQQATGSCSVLVTGRAGCGKTELVRQYVWQARARNTYPGGIFWVDARTRENAYRSFREIGQTAAVIGANKSQNQGWDVGSKHVDAVRKWLEARYGWLLVFDGLVLNDEDELSDFSFLVPDKKGNCIIITSVDRTLRGRQLLLSPTSIKVQPLSTRDGCSLLFNLLDIKHPSVAQMAKARELVKYSKGLPQAIYTAAHALTTKGLALETYTPGFTEKRLAANEELDETASMLSVNSVGLSATGSSTTLIGEVLAAANEFVGVLLTDRDLDCTFSVALDYITPENLRRKIREHLKTYSYDLMQEANDSLEKEAVQLVRRRRAYIASAVCQRYDLSIGKHEAPFEEIISQNPEKRALLEQYLRTKSNPTQGSEGDDEGGVPGFSSEVDVPGSSSEGEPDEPELSDLDRVKAFMVQSAAYQRFRQNIRGLIPQEDSEPIPPTSLTPWSVLPSQPWRIARTKITETVQALQMLLRPLIPRGHQRITWICGCGDYRYADIREHEMGGASKLQMALRRSAAATTETRPNVDSPMTLSTPPRAHLSGGPIGRVSSINDPNTGLTQSTVQGPANQIKGQSSQNPPSPQIEHKFLLLCMSISGATILEHLNIGDLGNDEYLWNKIRDQYNQARGKALWYQKIALTRWLSTMTWLTRLFAATDLTIAKSVQFVRFQLVPIGMDVRPWNLRAPDFPPEAEVKIKKTYDYVPCPAEVDPSGLNGELLHHLWKPGPHLDRYWLNTFPKKLKETLQYTSSKPDVNTGWGIHVVEGTNWATVTLLAFVSIVVSILLAVVYSAITHDVGGGFGMAAVVGTLPALGIAVLQLRPME